jgi:hypothetical protein
VEDLGCAGHFEEAEVGGGTISDVDDVTPASSCTMILDPWVFRVTIADAKL